MRRSSLSRSAYRSLWIPAAISIALALCIQGSTLVSSSSARTDDPKPFAPDAPPANLTGQLWYSTEGNNEDAHLAYINNNGTNYTIVQDNEPSTPPVGFASSFIEDVVLDTAAGLYYVLVDGNQGVNAKLLMGSIGSATPPTVVFTFDPSFVNTENNLAFGLHIDPINERLYVGFIEFNPVFGNATQGVRRFTYNPTTGTVTDGGLIYTQTVANVAPSAPGATPLFIPRDFDIDYTRNLMYASQYTLGDGFETNTLVRINLANLAAASVPVVNQALFPLNGNGSDFTTLNGIIQDVEVDADSNRVYFATHAEDVEEATGEDAIWVVANGSTASSATPVKLALSPGSLSPLFTTTNFYPGDMVLDEVNDILYVESENSNAVGGGFTDIILTFQLAGDGLSATLIDTVSPGFDQTANIEGMTFDRLAVLGALSPTAVQPIEQVTHVDLLTAAPAITDFESDRLNNATVRISNSFVGSGDHLYALDGATQRTTGIFTGTNITISRTTDGSGNQTLTLTGYDTFANYQNVLNAVTFFPNGDNPTNYGSNTTRTLTWQANDGAGGNPGGTANVAPTNVRTSSITIVGVNDAPVNNGIASKVGNEDTLIPIGGLSITDVDANPASQNLTVALSVTNGTLNLNLSVVNGITGANISAGANGTSSVTITATQNQINATLANATGLRYQGNSNYHGPDTLHIVTNDNGNTPAPAQTDTDDLGITVNSVNDAPAGADNTKTNLEDNSYTFATADFGFSDAADAAGPSGANSFLAVRFTTLPAGTLLDNGVPVTGGGSVLASHITAGQLVYTPTLNGNGNGFGNFTFQVQDNGGTANSGVDLDQSPNNFTVNVTAVNDAPAGTNNSKVILEDGSYTFAAADFGFTDPTDANAPSTSGANTFQNVIITTVPAAGTLTLSSVAVVANQSVTVANIPNLTFAPAANGNGSPYTSFTFQVQDNGGTANSGVDTDQSANTFTFNVTPVSDAPVLNALATPVLNAVNEDAGAPSGAVGTLVSSLVDFAGGGGLDNVTDPDNSSSTGIAVTAANTTNGAWFYTVNGGTNWFALGAVTDDAARFLAADPSTRIYFQPSLNFNSTVSNAITFRAWDQTIGSNGGTGDPSPGGGTTAFSTDSDTADITVDAVNDAPSFTKGPNDAVPLNFGARTLPNWATSISKGPADESGQTVTFNVTGNTNPALFSVLPAIDGTTGTLTYTTANGVSGSSTISLTLSDNGGNTPPNTDTSAPQMFTISVGPTASNGVVTGRIVDDNGAPVEGAVVRLEGTQNRKFITDANGFYRFDNVETNGFYTVTPSRANYSFTPSVRSFSQIGESTEAAFGATLTTSTLANPLDTPEYFVRQHYLDFLNREPDEAGFNFWSDQIIECGTDANCLDRSRENVSAAYFLSIEFQKTGGLVDGLYRAAYGARPSFSQFMPDTRAVGQGVRVGIEGWEALLAANTQTFVNTFVNRAAFIGVYGNMSDSQYVDTLIGHTGVSFTAAEREALVSGLGSGSMTRAQALRSIAENNRFVQAKFNETFVMMEYFGYLRRDADVSGFAYWLHKLNQFNGNFEQAEMVRAFIVSSEFRDRFPR